MRSYYTINGIKEIISVPIHEVYSENKWITIELDNGVRIKIKNF